MQPMCTQLEATGLQSREADAAASQLGKAIGMAALLRGTGYHASRWIGMRWACLPLPAATSDVNKLDIGLVSVAHTDHATLLQAAYLPARGPVQGAWHPTRGRVEQQHH